MGRGDRCCGGVEPATAGGGEWAVGDSGAANGGGASGSGSAVSLVLVGAVADWVSRVLADWV